MFYSSNIVVLMQIIATENIHKQPPIPQNKGECGCLVQPLQKLALLWNNNIRLLALLIMELSTTGIIVI